MLAHGRDLEDRRLLNRDLAADPVVYSKHPRTFFGGLSRYSVHACHTQSVGRSTWQDKGQSFTIIFEICISTWVGVLSFSIIALAFLT
jgi:hypothetical protein